MHKNPPLQQQRARELRQNSTDAERWLWQRLRNRQLLGQKFRRQVPISQYIVDFLCHECKLVVEIDGSQHQQQTDYDDRRTQFLERQGYRVVRYWNNEVLQQGEAVLESIVQALADRRERPLTPTPLPAGERGLSHHADPAAFRSILDRVPQRAPLEGDK
jgi:very-short-patch-repair endonuclease